jgi:hypothetical protein
MFLALSAHDPKTLGASFSDFSASSPRERHARYKRAYIYVYLVIGMPKIQDFVV